MTSPAVTGARASPGDTDCRCGYIRQHAGISDPALFGGTTGVDAFHLAAVTLNGQRRFSVGREPMAMKN